MTDSEKATPDPDLKLQPCPPHHVTVFWALSNQCHLHVCGHLQRPMVI